MSLPGHKEQVLKEVGGDRGQVRGPRRGTLHRRHICDRASRTPAVALRPWERPRLLCGQFLPHLPRRAPQVSLTLRSSVPAGSLPTALGRQDSLSSL